MPHTTAAPSCPSSSYPTIRNQTSMDIPGDVEGATSMKKLPPPPPKRKNDIMERSSAKQFRIRGQFLASEFWRLAWKHSDCSFSLCSFSSIGPFVSAAGVAPMPQQHRPEAGDCDGLPLLVRACQGSCCRGFFSPPCSLCSDLAHLSVEASKARKPKLSSSGHNSWMCLRHPGACFLSFCHCILHQKRKFFVNASKPRGTGRKWFKIWSRQTAWSKSHLLPNPQN